MTFAFAAFLFFLAVGTPIVFVLGISATLTLILTTDVPISTIAQRIFGGMNHFTIMAVPFFILAGMIMDAGGLSRRIVEFATALVGWITGSLLMVAVTAATGLAAISGSGTADTAAISAIMQPELKRRKYDVDFAAALIASAGTQAQVVPPSLMMIVIAAVANLSVGALFLAGILPGLVAAIGLLAVGYLHARRGGPQYRQVEPFSLRRLWSTFWVAIPALVMPVIIVGGIVGGVFTPTEAAAVAAAYGIFVGMFVYRDLKPRDFPTLMMKSVSFSAAVLWIIATASILGWLVANANIPDQLAAWLQGVVSSPAGYLLILNVLLMVIGCFMETLAAILILVPVLMPIAVSYGIDPHHFAVVVVMNFAIGLITPPFGGAVFVAATVAEREVFQVFRKVLWPWLVMTSVLLLATYVPGFPLFLPRLFGFL